MSRQASKELLWTTDDLELLPDNGNRYEVIGGILFVSRAPSLLHQHIIGMLITKLNNYLETHPIGKAWITPGVKLSSIDGVIPDLVFVRKERLFSIASGEHLQAAPDLAVEILSPGTENIRRDRVAKLKLYSNYSVLEYWVIDPKKKIVEIYRLKDTSLKLAETLDQDQTISSALLPDFVCKLAELFS